ncbi:hypothetical protein GXG07_22175 [Escherichia coli]|nr:hypothetical protein [Escherichia coli]
MDSNESVQNNGTVWIFNSNFRVVTEKRIDGTNISHIAPHYGKSKLSLEIMNGYNSMRPDELDSDLIME